MKVDCPVCRSALPTMLDVMKSDKELDRLKKLMKKHKLNSLDCYEVSYYNVGKRGFNIRGGYVRSAGQSQIPYFSFGIIRGTKYKGFEIYRYDRIELGFGFAKHSTSNLIY